MSTNSGSPATERAVSNVPGQNRQDQTALLDARRDLVTDLMFKAWRRFLQAEKEKSTPKDAHTSERGHRSTWHHRIGTTASDRQGARPVAVGDRSDRR